MSDDTFVTYTHPDQQYDKKNRRKIASYIGTHYRNRSRPAARQASELGHAAQTNRIAFSKPILPDKKSCQLVLNKRKAPSKIPRDGYGIRGDPFTSYPIKDTKCVPGAVDYFLNFYAPTHVIRSGLVAAGNSTIVVKQYFRLALSHPLLFEASVALSQTNLTLNQSADRDGSNSNITPRNTTPDSEALFHYGKALAKLRKTLGDEAARTEDAVIFAIATLMGVDYLIGNLASFETHLGGLRRIISLRGGIDAVGWPTLLKPLLNGCVSFGPLPFITLPAQR